jgi:hypothetical protein
MYFIHLQNSTYSTRSAFSDLEDKSCRVAMCACIMCRAVRIYDFGPPEPYIYGICTVYRVYPYTVPAIIMCYCTCRRCGRRTCGATKAANANESNSSGRTAANKPSGGLSGFRLSEGSSEDSGERRSAGP